MSGSNVIDVHMESVPDINGVQQWLRKGSLILGDASGAALDFSNLRFTFDVHRAVVAAPNYALIRIYNVNSTTAQKVIKEFSQVVLKAGYEGNEAEIFKGQVVYTVRGNNAGELVEGPQHAAIFSNRESPTDTFLEITAADGSSAYNFGRGNVSLAAGTGFEDTINSLAPELKKYNVTIGAIPFDSEVKWPLTPRAQTFSGSLRSVLDEICNTINAKWSIQLGALEIVLNTQFLPGPAVVVGPRTGMIGQPRQTINDGVEFTCLLNPYIRMNRLIKLDPQAIQQVAPPVAYGILDTTQEIDPKGEYRAVKIVHSGDTRGNNWYTYVTAIPKTSPGRSPSQPSNQVN